MGDIEFGTCQMCGNTAHLSRKYYHYDIKCTCCYNSDGHHFLYVAYCSNCEPKPPDQITVYISPLESQK